MSTNQQAFGTVPGAASQQPDLGRKYEGIAFTFCKAGTLALAAQLIAGPKFILPLIALGTSAWYVAALLKGNKTTRCILRVPLIIIAFWVLIGGLYAWYAWRGNEAFSLLGLITGGRT